MHVSLVTLNSQQIPLESFAISSPFSFALNADPTLLPIFQHFKHSLITSFVPFVWLYFGVLMFVMIFAERLEPYKMDQKPIDRKLLRKEIRRSATSVLMLSIWDVVLTRFFKIQFRMFTPLRAVAILVTTLFWADIHFFTLHSFLHTIPKLYKTIHKYHHESVNPNVMSGLSFHPVEGFLYFSSLIIAIFISFSKLEYLILKIGIMVAPLNGHLGYKRTMRKNLDVEKCEHYIHHTKFNYNFGSGMWQFFGEGFIWDRFFGTGYRNKNSR